jgi:hypothetical protein
MTDDDNILARLTGFTPGTWELDPVKGDWMGGFYSGETSVCTFGEARDYYPTEGEPPNYANAQLIAAAPDLHRIATEQVAEITRLRGALDLIARHRYRCHAYDDDVGHPLRDFDVEDVRIMEYVAKTALAAKS